MRDVRRNVWGFKTLFFILLAALFVVWLLIDFVLYKAPSEYVGLAELLLTVIILLGVFAFASKKVMQHKQNRRIVGLKQLEATYLMQEKTPYTLHRIEKVREQIKDLENGIGK